MKRLEDALDVRLCNANARVLDFKRESITSWFELLSTGTEANRSMGRKFDGVREQIQENLPKLALIGRDDRGETIERLIRKTELRLIRSQPGNVRDLM